jgi:hypothetical protein
MLVGGRMHRLTNTNVPRLRALRLTLAFPLICASWPALAAPPADCVTKFVGGWIVTVNATGQTYPSTIRPDGTLSSVCPLCAPVQTWTCQGNTFILTGPGSATQTLSADGKMMTGSCCTAARVGPPTVRVNAPTTNTPTVRAPAPNIPPPPPPKVRTEEPYIVPPTKPTVRAPEPRTAPRPKPTVKVQEPQVAPPSSPTVKPIE